MIYSKGIVYVTLLCFFVNKIKYNVLHLMQNMSSMNITILGHEIEGREKDYYSLTDIAKIYSKQRPSETIRTWLRNTQTVLFLEAWERLHNPDFNVDKFVAFRLAIQENHTTITMKRYMELGIGIVSKAGRYGGSFAHIEIALEFASWLDPNFKVYMFKTWIEMKTQSEQMNLDWHIDMLDRNTKENLNLLETLRATTKKVDKS